MDKAIEELRYTIDQAREYFENDEHYLEELNCHSTALKEDMEAVEKQKTVDKELEKAADEVIRKARRLKRDLDKLSFPLLRAQQATEIQLRKEALEIEKAASLRNNTGTPHSSSEKKGSTVKLPTIKLPTFSGEVEHYRGFKQVFLDIISEEPEISSVKKWLLLKEHLAGKALEIVQELPAAPETFTVAMELLDEAFGSVNKAVTHLYHRLQKLAVAEMNGESLRLTYSKIDGMLRSLELLGEDVNTNRFLRTVIISKYPKELLNLVRVTDEMDLSKFRKEMSGYLKSHENSLEFLVPAKPSSQIGYSTHKEQQEKVNRTKNLTSSECSSSSNEKKKTTSSSAHPEKYPSKKPFTRIKKCSFCAAEHYSDECDTYNTLEQRQKKLADRCTRCLKQPHTGKDCIRLVKCAHCGETTHNRALCPKKFSPKERTMCIREQQKIMPVCATQENVSCGYLTLMLDAANSASKEKLQSGRAVIDTGSRRTLITRSFAEKIGVKEEAKTVNLVGIADVPIAKEPSPTCKLYLHPLNHKPIYVEAVIVDHIAKDIVSANIADFRNKYPQFGQLNIPEEGNGREIDVLIGNRTLLPILTLQNSIFVDTNVQLLSTKFGWVIFGGFQEKDEEEESAIAVMMLQNMDPIKLMCDLDVVGLKDIERNKDEEERIALEKFYEIINFLDNRYEVGIPYRYEPPDLSDNFGLAWGRLLSLYKKLKANPELLYAYHQQIKSQAENGIIEAVNDANEKGKRVHYIPHQVVLRMDKSTPVRIVLDASSHAAGKRSLNDNILKGANWVDDMPAMLMRFRKNEVAITADIERAFHQLSIRPEDRDVCRFLWLKDQEKPPTTDNLQIYRFRRVAFGIASSPFLLYATIKYHLRKYPHEYTKILEQDFYADNLVTSVPASTDLPSFYTKTKQSFNSMSMNLTKWTSSSETLLKSIPVSDQSTDINQTVLGIRWNTNTDKIGIQVKQNTFNAQAQLTKRRILKEAASIFDPLGWAMPVVLIARIFIRRLWKMNYTWDQPITEDLANEWRKIWQALQSISTVELPRRMFTSRQAGNISTWEVHVFGDASIETYAVVAFIRAAGEIAFVAAKSRLAPSAKLSIPKLELIAAVTASRFAKYVRSSLKIENAESILWSDSKCVLSWLKSGKILPASVQKAVQEIRNNGVTTSNYVPTELNPADIATRGADIPTLQKINWWSGPLWLIDKEQWPPQNISTANEENRAINTALRIHKEKILFTRINVAEKKFNPEIVQNSLFGLNPTAFSTLEALLRRSAFILQAVNRIFYARIHRKIIPIDNERTNFTFVREKWLLWDQKRAYEEIPLKKPSNVAYLRNLKVFRDAKEIIHCVTRLENSAKDAETVYPILLVKNSPLTKLIVMSIHNNNLHAGTSHTLASLRKAYWLPHGRQQVFQIIRKNCPTCRKYSNQPFASPDMAPLPEFRIKQTETPFRNIGLDIFGPYNIRSPKQPGVMEKRWIIIFTCLVVRAVHLELLSDMTTNEVLHAFRRFIARRGAPEIVVCDNAPQFHVIEHRFQSLWHYIAENKQIVDYFAEKEINWRFIPAHAPWMGGVYERLIKTAKDAFEKAYPTVIMTEKQMTTILVEVEGMLNARPISYVDKNIDTPIITPNHFLCVRYPAVPINFDETQPQDQITELWRAAENYLNVYWRRWSEQYLLALRERIDDMKNPHLSQKREPKVGEIVLMVDPTVRRSSWRKAIIERLLTSGDGKIRSAQIKIANGARMIRPITKLLPLDLITDLPEVDRMQLNRAATALVFPAGESVNQENIDRFDE